MLRAALPTNSEPCTSALKETTSEPVRAATTLYTARKRLPLIYGRIAQNCEIAEVDSNPVMVSSLVIQERVPRMHNIHA